MAHPGLVQPDPQLAQQSMAPSSLGYDPLHCRGLYIGNLDPKVSDSLLWQIFSTIGPVEGCKVIKDKNGQGSGYGFVDYYDHDTAERALQNLNGKKIYNSDIKVNWAYAGGQREDSTSGHFHIFVGDLSPELDDKALYLAFLAFGSCTDARVMWDQNTGRSRGYGFVAFQKKEDAERALQGMNGEWLGNRAIRCNWANQKVTSTSASDLANNNDLGAVINQTPPTNTTVYVGNLTPDYTDEPLIRTIFDEHGVIEEIRLQKDKGFAFVKFQAHDQAARAIASVHGRAIGSKVVKCSWGKERTQNNTPSYQAPLMPASVPYSAYAQPVVQQYAGYGQYPYTYPYAAYNQAYQYGYQPYGDPYGGAPQ